MLKDAEVVVTAWETGELTDLLDYTPRLQMVIHSGARSRMLLECRTTSEGWESLPRDPAQCRTRC